MVRTIVSSSGNRQTASRIVPDAGPTVNSQFCASTRDGGRKLGRFCTTVRSAAYHRNGGITVTVPAQRRLEAPATMEVTEKFVALVTRAHEYLSAQQDVLREEFRLANWQRWHWDQDTGLLVFSDGDGVPHLIAEVQFVGSISTVSGTWLWAWANSTVDAALIRGVAQVRAFGEREDIAQLTTDKWEATEVDGWEMTSIAAYLLQARGGYRTPSDTGFTYMVMSSIRWAEPQ
jgi:hypothetical protein